MNTYKIPISELFFSEIGTIEPIYIEVPEVDNLEATVTTGQTIEVTGIKIEDAVCFYTQDQKIEISFNCARCLTPVTKKILLRNLEKHYYVKTPEDVEDDLVELIDKKKFEINLQPFLEELVILSVPTVLLCADDCHGSISLDSQNLNDTALTKQSPFSNLKDLLK